MDEQKLNDTFALSIISEISYEEKSMLVDWLENLLKIRDMPISKRKKATEAIRVTLNKDIIFPIIKNISKKAKTHLWDRQGIEGRFAAIAAPIGLAMFGGQSAGIAALGGAIGVPLWIVFAGGASVAGRIVDHIKNKDDNVMDVAYSVIKDNIL